MMVISGIGQEVNNIDEKVYRMIDDKNNQVG